MDAGREGIDAGRIQPAGHLQHPRQADHGILLDVEVTVR